MKRKNFIKNWYLLFIFIFLILIGVISHYLQWKFMDNLYTVLDASSGVAIAFFAGFGFYEYVKSKDKKEQYLKEMATLKSLDSNNGAIVIRFGSHASIDELHDFAKSVVEDTNFIMIKEFPSEIEQTDIVELEEFLDECKAKLSDVETIEIIYAGLVIGYAVVGDALSNWKPLNYYHYNGQYELWYSDQKHRLKRVEEFKNIHENMEMKKLNPFK